MQFQAEGMLIFWRNRLALRTNDIAENFVKIDVQTLNRKSDKFY